MKTGGERAGAKNGMARGSFLDRSYMKDRRETERKGAPGIFDRTKNLPVPLVSPG